MQKSMLGGKHNDIILQEGTRSKDKMALTRDMKKRWREHQYYGSGYKEEQRTEDSEGEILMGDEI